MAGRAPAIVSFGRLDESWVRRGDLAYNAVFIGGRGEPSAPVAIVLHAGPDVGDRIAGTRVHSAACSTVVLEGSVQLDGRWLRRGEIQIAPACTAHGDLVIGPEGALLFLMFAQREGLVPQFADPSDQRLFDAELRDDVEAVASGGEERPVALLPMRDTHSERRGVVTDLDEIARLKAASPFG